MKKYFAEQKKFLSLKCFESVSESVTKEFNWNLMKGNVTQVNGGIIKNVDVSVQNVMYVKKIIFGTLLHVALKMETFWQMLWIIQRLRVMKL